MKKILFLFFLFACFLPVWAETIVCTLDKIEVVDNRSRTHIEPMVSMANTPMTKTLIIKGLVTKKFCVS